MGGRRAGASLRGVQASGADGSFKGDAPPVDAAGSGGALNFSPAAPDTGSRMEEPVVLVVGAGLSGLTYASELLRRPGSPRVVVLEASNRTHPPLPPRLLSQQGKGTENPPCACCWERHPVERTFLAAPVLAAREYGS